MIRAQPETLHAQAAITRLNALAPLTQADVRTIATASSELFAPRRELATERRPIRQSHLILSGWAARVRTLYDGRRQFISFLLPGDLVGLCRQVNPLASSTVVALTPVTACALPSDPSASLLKAYASSTALDEAYLLGQVVRLGRMNAQERILDLLLELLERLTLNGTAVGNRFTLPITQEVLADALGLTSVHINRMLMAVRRRDALSWTAGSVTIRDPQALASEIGRLPTKISQAEVVTL